MLASQLTSDVPSSRKRASWALCNIAAGNVDQIDALIKHPTIVRDVLANFTCAWPDVQMDSVWTVANMTVHGSREQLQILVEEHAAAEALCAVAASTADLTVVDLALRAVRKCLSAYERDDINALVNRLRNTVAQESLSHHDHVRALLICSFGLGKYSSAFDWFCR